MASIAAGITDQTSSPMTATRASSGIQAPLLCTRGTSPRWQSRAPSAPPRRCRGNSSSASRISPMKNSRLPCHRQSSRAPPPRSWPWRRSVRSRRGLCAAPRAQPGAAATTPASQTTDSSPRPPSLPPLHASYRQRLEADGKMLPSLHAALPCSGDFGWFEAMVRWDKISGAEAGRA